jgi:hypothetical protein
MHKTIEELKLLSNALPAIDSVPITYASSLCISTTRRNTCREYRKVVEQLEALQQQRVEGGEAAATKECRNCATYRRKLSIIDSMAEQRVGIYCLSSPPFLFFFLFAF